MTDATGQWYGNSLRFATEAEAVENARDLFYRWTLCTAHRAAPSDDAPEHTYIDGELGYIEKAAA